MGKLKLKPTGLLQPNAQRVKVGDSWILKKDYDRILKIAWAEAEKSITESKLEAEKARYADTQSNWLYASFALALHREYGWGAVRISRALRAVDKVAGEICDIYIDDIWDYVSEETGLMFVKEEEQE